MANDDHEAAQGNDTRAEIIKSVGQVVPLVYQDGLQPALKRVGTSLATAAGVINIALAPLAILVWGYERIQEYIEAAVTERLKKVPAEKIVTPSPHVAVPIIEALRYTAQEQELRDLYANLLAASMNADTKQSAHPAFVEVIKQMTPDEATLLNYIAATIPLPTLNVSQIMKKGEGGAEQSSEHLLSRDFSLFGESAGCKTPDRVKVSLANFERLGVIERLPHGQHFTKEGVYTPLEEHPTIKKLSDAILATGQEPLIERAGFRLTEFGAQFCSTCVVPKTPKA